MISTQALDLKKADASSMAVVVHPDSHTELLLQLRQEGGVVVVQARCERGDWQQLNQQWDGLQASLSRQGIDLGNLERSRTEPFQSGQFSAPHQESRSSSGQEQPERHAPRSTETAESLDSEVDRQRAKSTQPALGRTSSARKWETWA